jgi:hypothetical protein
LIFGGSWFGIWGLWVYWGRRFKARNHLRWIRVHRKFMNIGVWAVFAGLGAGFWVLGSESMEALGSGFSIQG